MIFISVLNAAVAIVATVAAAPAIRERGTTDDNNFALAIGGGRFNINYLQTFKLSYSNDSIYLGQIKYQAYSEPFIVGGADVGGAADGLTFLSIHQSVNGYQNAYIVPRETQPIGLSTPHGTAPQGVRTTGWGFDGSGTLTNNGRNLFYACQNAELAEINSYQVWWWGGGEPNGVSCLGPIHIQRADACARD